MSKDRSCSCPHCETELKNSCMSPKFCKPCCSKENNSVKVCSACKSEYSSEYDECPSCAANKNNK
jgi:hypothetical protein